MKAPKKKEAKMFLNRLQDPINQLTNR